MNLSPVLSSRSTKISFNIPLAIISSPARGEGGEPSALRATLFTREVRHA